MRKDGRIGGAAPCGWVGDRVEKESKVLKWQPPFHCILFLLFITRVSLVGFEARARCRGKADDEWGPSK
jgi:hypothetical protein